MKTYKFSLTAVSLIAAAFLGMTGCSDDSSSSAISAATTATTTSGSAVDGYLQGATVFVDENNNTIQDSSEQQVTTDANGDFALSGTVTNGTKIYIYGGIDKSTGYPFEGRLSLVYESGQKPIVSPVSTYVAALVDQNMTVAEAKALAAANLGIDVADIDKDPMTVPALFLAAQKVQKTAEVLAAATVSTDFNAAYEDVFASLATLTENNTTGGDFNATALTAQVATDSGIAIPANVPTFLEAYTQTVDDFGATSVSTTALDGIGEVLNTYTEVVEGALDANDTAAIDTYTANLAALDVNTTVTAIDDGNFTDPLVSALSQVEDALDNNVSYLGTNTADNNITANLVLTDPAAAPFDTNDLNLTWSSNNSALDASTGAITPAYVDTPVVLKATLNNALVSNFREYNLVIKRMEVAPTAGDLNVTTNEDTNKTVDLSSVIGDLNGDTPVVTAVGSATNGTATLTNGTVTYTPNLNFNGSDSFTYTVRDNTGQTAQGTVNVTVNPIDDPTVWHTSTDLGTQLEDFAFMIVDLNATDVDGNVTYTIGTYSAGIAPTLSASTLTIASVSNANGAQTVVVTASEGGVDTNQTFTLNVTAVDDAAVWQSTPSLTAVNEDFTTPVTVDLNATDVDNPIVYSSVSDNGIVTSSLIGSTLTLSAVENANGNAIVVVAANGVEQTITLTVNSVNDAPVVPSNDLTLSIITNGTLTGQLNATDVDGNSLVFSNASVTAGVISLNSDGTFTYTADATTGAVTFTYDVSDGTDTVQGTQTINVVASNPPDVVDDIATVVEDSNVIIDVLANDTDDNTATADLNITATTAPANGSIVVNSDKTITYTPTTGFTGSDSFTYTIADSDGGTSTATVTVTVTPLNNAPVLANGTLTILVGESVSFTLNATDADSNDTLTYSLDAASDVNRTTTSITSSGVVTITGDTVGGATLYVDVNDSKTVTQATYAVSVIGPQKHYNGYNPSDAGSVPATTYDGYSAIAMPKDTTIYSLYGTDTNSSGAVEFDVSYMKFDSNGTFEMLENGEVQTGYTYTENTTTHELTVTDPSGTALAAVKLLSTFTTPTDIANDLNVSMPEGTVVYHAAFKMLQDTYDFWQETKDYSTNPETTYASLQEVFDAGVAVNSKTNYKRALMFAPDDSLSSGSGTLVEVDLTDYFYNGGSPLILDANAGTWSVETDAQVNGGNSEILVLAPNDTEIYDRKIFVLDDFGLQGIATNTVWEGEFNPADTVWLETDFNEKALAVEKNIAKVVTPLFYTFVKPMYAGDINATEFADMNQSTDPSGLTLTSLNIEMNATTTDYDYRRLVSAFATDGTVDVTEYVNDVANPLYNDASYTYNADNNVTLDTHVFKIGPAVYAADLYAATGFSLDSASVAYMTGHADTSDGTYDKDYYFNAAAAEIIRANFDNFYNSLNYTYEMVDNRTVYIIDFSNGTQNVFTFVYDDTTGTRTLYKTVGSFTQDYDPIVVGYSIDSTGKIVLDDGTTIEMTDIIGTVQVALVSDGGGSSFLAAIYLNENDANNALALQP